MTVSKDYLQKMDAYWRAANYLSAAQLYLLDNPLLREPLRKEHIKKKIVGHWGTVPGQNFVYVHMNRAIKEFGLNMIYLSGPGHGGNFFVSNAYLEGTYSEVYPNVGEDEEGLKRLCKQFSFPGGISSHVAPETPGSINEGGELLCWQGAIGIGLRHDHAVARAVQRTHRRDGRAVFSIRHKRRFHLIITAVFLLICLP